MSRPGRCRSLSILTAALFALALPAAAQAANYTIQPGGGPCGGLDTICGGFPQAVAAPAANGDNFTVKAGTYAPGATFTVGVNITGEPGATLQGMLGFGGATLSTLKNFNVIQPGNSLAIYVSGAGGAEISDVLAVSGEADAIRIINSTANKIVRSVMLTLGPLKHGLRVDASATGGPDIGLVISASIMSGGSAGLGVFTNLAGGHVGVTARHVTITGTSGTEVATGASLGLLDDTATVSVSDSISLTNDVANVGINSSVAFPNTMQTGDPATIFADPVKRNFHLKPGSPAIGAGGTLDPSESQTDIDGQARPAPVDQGADEYSNTAPRAAIAIKSAGRRVGESISFSGAASRDQPGGSIASYRWQFGDGTTKTTSTAFITHTYSAPGLKTATLTVVDGEGVASTPASVNLTVIENILPAAVFTKPKHNQKIFQFVRKTKTVTKNGKKVRIKVKTKRRTRIKFDGVAADASGILRVYMTLQKLGDSSTSKCRWYDPKRGLRRVDCDEPFLIRGHLRADKVTWFYNVPKSIKLPKGTYRARVSAIDKTGNIGNIAPKSKSIKFKIR